MSLLLAALASCAAFDEPDVYISLPDIREVRKWNAKTGTIEPFATGVYVPFYGQVDTSGNVYLQDALVGVVWKIAPDGTKKVLTSGNLLHTPLSITIHPTTGDLYVSEAYYQQVVKIDAATGAQSVFSDNSQGLYSVPGGLAFDRDGNLWMTDHGNYWIFKIDPSGVATPFFDGAANGIVIPAGIEADHAGNLFVASYGSNVVIRVRTDTAEWEVFADDPILDEPNDVTMSPDGSGLIVSCGGTSALVKIDSLGRVSTICQDASLGEFLGAAVPGNYPGCTGHSDEFGSGTAGSGGYVPRLRGIFNPSPGADLTYDVDHLNGGASCFFLWSIGTSSLPIWGGDLYLDFTSAWGVVPFLASGTGAGNGGARLRFTHPDDPGLVGLDIGVQVVAFDAGNAYHKALSNGLELVFGSY
jgi:DNA-binding beta-propeller fold protein YncE